MELKAGWYGMIGSSPTLDPRAPGPIMIKNCDEQLLKQAFKVKS